MQIKFNIGQIFRFLSLRNLCKFFFAGCFILSLKKREKYIKKKEKKKKEKRRRKNLLHGSHDFLFGGEFSLFVFVPLSWKSRLLERFSFYACNFYGSLMGTSPPVIRNRVFNPFLRGWSFYIDTRRIDKSSVKLSIHRSPASFH